jgi:DNA invertase Pin-like site-specific DNA recombinase
MEKNKATAVYARTSNKKQNFELQIEAASPYLKGIDSEGLFYFVDEGISGSSKPVELLKLIDFIKEGRIDTLVVYERSRLTTSLDTYLELINLFDRHQVKVIFPVTLHTEIENTSAKDLAVPSSNPLARSKPATLKYPSSMAYEHIIQTIMRELKNG